MGSGVGRPTDQPTVSWVAYLGPFSPPRTDRRTDRLTSLHPHIPHPQSHTYTAALASLMAAAPPGTLLIAALQGDVYPVQELLEAKQRCRCG